MRVLVTAATRHDATREIAEAISAGLLARGIEAESRPIDKVTDLAGYDAVVLGSAVYMGRWLKLARRSLSTTAHRSRQSPCGCLAPVRSVCLETSSQPESRRTSPSS
jgi:menaquinone-dependent protoporphyrinogen oxidase